MKGIIKKVEKLAIQIEAELDKRIKYTDSRSENWQDSDNGEEYISKTDKLQELSEALTEFLT